MPIREVIAAKGVVIPLTECFTKKQKNRDGRLWIKRETAGNDGNLIWKSRFCRETEKGTEEADRVVARIAQVLSEKTFQFSPAEYRMIHKRLFSGIYDHVGMIRIYNITKRE